MSDEPSTTDSTDSVSQERVIELVDSMGGIANEDTAREALQRTSQSHDGDEEPHPQCEFCNSAAVVRGIAVVNTRAYLGTPLCAECHIPASEVTFPQEALREDILKEHSDSLITSPSDEVISNGDETIIRHGPGDESRVTLG